MSAFISAAFISSSKYISSKNTQTFQIQAFLDVLSRCGASDKMCVFYSSSEQKTGFLQSKLDEEAKFYLLKMLKLSF